MPFLRLNLDASPADLFQALRRGPFNTWLDSAGANRAAARSSGASDARDREPQGVSRRHRTGRFDYIYTQPSAVFSWHGQGGTLRWPAGGGLAEKFLQRRLGGAHAVTPAPSPRQAHPSTMTGPFVPHLLTALAAAAALTVGPVARVPLDAPGADGEADAWFGVSLKGQPLVALGELLAAVATGAPHEPHPDRPPVVGAAVGYLGYDLGRHLERLPCLARDELALPEISLAFHNVSYIFDHRLATWYAAAGSWGGGGRAPRSRWDAGIIVEEAGVHACQALEAGPSSPAAATGGDAGGLCSLARGDALAPAPYVSRQAYEAAAARVQEYIAAGDVFQVNLSQRFATPFAADPFQLYRRLRSVSPEPYGAFMETPQVALCSASPELFLEVRGRAVTTRPIKGTRPRGSTEEEDRRLAQELKESEKDRAELLMITDLERNDLGRVCEAGTVTVPRLVSLETHPQVFHLVSTISGRLRDEVQVADLLAATFPGGSITGAPKIRAMEIIEELEPVRRGPYTGAMGHLGFNGAVDLNIVIRTMWCAAARLYLQVGGGIVADSDPAGEYMETLHKARGMLQALAGPGRTSS